MQLEKYYLDVVGPDGSGCIGYAARPEGFALDATVAATLQWNVGDRTAPTQRRTLRGKLPAVESGRVTWRCPAIGVEGAWAGGPVAGDEITLWTGPRGAVRWQLLAPRASVRLRLGAQTVEGWGYAERLRLDLAPWHLPVDTLRWGRFVSPGHNVVWTGWEHATPRRWLWHNGVAETPLALADTRVAWRGWRLHIGAGQTLRTGRLAETVFSRWPGLQRLVPRQILAFEESKWCAPGTLTGCDGVRAQGWVIHEHVRFR